MEWRIQGPFYSCMKELFEMGSGVTSYRSKVLPLGAQVKANLSADADQRL